VEIWILLLLCLTQTLQPFCRTHNKRTSTEPRKAHYRLVHEDGLRSFLSMC